MPHETELRPETFEAVNLSLLRALFARGLEVGDELRLLEYEAESGRYSGRWVDVRVTHVMVLVRSKLCSIEVVRAGAAEPYYKDDRGNRRAA